jgi:hypothetical protein
LHHWRWSAKAPHADASNQLSQIASGQIHDFKEMDTKNQDFQPAVNWLPKYVSTIIYCCIVLLQIL